MRVDNGARSGGIIGISFRFSFTGRYIVCTHKNRLTEAILMSTHNIPFSVQNKKITINYPKSAAKGVFPRD